MLFGHGMGRITGLYGHLLQIGHMTTLFVHLRVQVTTLFGHLLGHMTTLFGHPLGQINTLFDNLLTWLGQLC